MTPRTRSILMTAAISVMTVAAIVHYVSGAYRSAWWFMSFLQVSMPVFFAFLMWSFRRDLRGLADGSLAVAGRRLSLEVNLAIWTAVGWIALATYGARHGFPDNELFPWLALGAFGLWLAWFIRTMRRARGHAFNFEPKNDGTGGRFAARR